MGVCELCGSERVSTRKTQTSTTIIDCCIKCSDSLGLSPINEKKYNSKIITKPLISKSSNYLIGTETEELIPNFHIKIRKEREIRGWDIEQLAKKTNEKVNMIQKIENGYRVTDATIKKISKALDINLFSPITPQNERIIKSKEMKEMTMADANISQNDIVSKQKNTKRKMRRLGVSRIGGRKRKKD
tara:strand:+ start:932 stop:1492 length:561 start_codon:yes stop_codon:yes gene_type:complete